MAYNNPHFEKLLSGSIPNLIKEVKNSSIILSPIKDPNFRRNVKYDIEDYIIGIIDVLKNNLSWKKYNGKIPGETLRKTNKLWSNLGVYKHAYENSLIKYFKTVSKTEELKYQSIDSTFISDVNGSKVTDFRGIYKRRKGEAHKGIKITSLVTSNGIPISVSIDTANKYDSTLLPDLINNSFIECNTKKYEKS